MINTGSRRALSLAWFLALWVSALPLAMAASSPTSLKVRIVRDSYGVPHIYADTVYALFYGYGYAVGQDRLFQMEMIKRTTAGRVAEVMGEDYLPLDKTVRQGFDPENLRAQLAQLNDEQLAVFAGYAAGLNHWIDEVNARPDALTPREYLDFGFRPSPWTAYDVVLVFAGSMAHRYADFNEEIDNLAFYRGLIAQHGQEKAWDIFNSSLPLYDPASPVTVPENEGRTPEIRYTGRQAPAYLHRLLGAAITPPPRAAFDKAGKFISIPDAQAGQTYRRKHLAGSGISGRAGFSSASNLWLVNGDKVEGAEGVLVNGPQFGWVNPSYVYGVGLHGAGYDVVGNTLLAFPFMLFAHNGHIAWGSTAGFGDLVDIFVNTVNPANPEEYAYQNTYQTLSKRQERIKIKGQADHIAAFYRSVHGPVVLLDEQRGLVFSKRRAWEGREVETGLAWVELAKAKDYRQWRRQLSRMATNINFYFLDRQGNIAYVHTGKYPLRAAEHDNRLPVIGDGAMDWRGYLPFAQNPHTYNPQQDFISNWNNRPARHWRVSDLWWRRWGRADRVDVLNKALRAQQRFTPAELWDINRRISFADVNAGYLLPHLREALAVEPATAPVRAAFAVLEQWDRRWQDSDNDGYYDSAAPLIMQTWLGNLLAATFKDDIGDSYFHRFASPGYPAEDTKASVAVSPGIKIIVDMLAGDTGSYDFFNGAKPQQVFYQTFAASVDTLRQQHGVDMRMWRSKPARLIFRAFNFRGAPQTTADNQPSLPVIMNRGSENNLFIADGERIRGRDVFAPGQSGFIAADGAKSAHYQDQLPLYQQFKTKPLPFSQQQVEAMQESETVLELRNPMRSAAGPKDH